MQRKGKIGKMKSRNIVSLILATVSPFMAATSCDNQATPGKSPSDSLPTISENVSWQIGDTIVAATISRPDDKSVHPAVVFVAGSGPTDRDWNSPLLPGNNGSARLLAEELAKIGYVTIRYDKRASGPNAEKNLPLLVGKISMESHVDELAGAVNQLVTRPEVDPNRVFVLTNSEGAIHALNYQRQAEKSRFSGLILTGPPGRSIAEVVKTQMQALFSTLPDSDKLMQLYEKAVSDFEAGRPVEPDPALPDAAKQLLLSLSSPGNLPFARELWSTDISPWLHNTNEPVLVVIGKKDIQVDYQLDGGRLEEAAKGKTNITFAYPENANHVLKYESSPRENLTAEVQLYYNSSDRVLDADALKIITEWLEQNN
jgi:pimeloyl-ACP methyl ester carboxylesterase